jgi:hypothetical protein
MNQTLYNISYNIIQQTLNNNIDKDTCTIIDKDIIYDSIMIGMHNYIIMYILLNYIMMVL